MTEEKLVCKNIVKTYGKTDVLQNVDLELEKGKIYGLIGRNGAGKTTLLSILSAQNPATKGTVTCNSMPVWENREALEHICFSREINPMGTTGQGNGYRVKDYLRAAAWYMPNWDKEMAERLVKEFNLDTKKKVMKLSKGMLSMLTIVIALASKADYTFLDEPVAGLDVVMREYFYRVLLEEFTESGRTFVISTHIIEEAADIFEEVIMIDKGKIIVKENTQDLLDRAVHVSGKAEEVDAATSGLNAMRVEKMGRSKGVTVLLKEGESVQRNADITVQPVSLQQLFVAMCGKEVG
ncbi:MAG: ABC transporter ATP-binding protein [Lachnospiraceae bacterium]|nr:ABC transporter ATP-binding protein [Lachnospiraceae bacterium]